MIYELVNGNGKVKEYGDEFRLKYVGEYLNGQKNGNVKEYDMDFYKIKYEGGYKNGKKNGKGKEYDWLSSNLIYEGEFLNGKKNGKGKDYYNNGIVFFEGEYLNGKKWDGILYDIKHKYTLFLEKVKGLVIKF